MELFKCYTPGMAEAADSSTLTRRGHRARLAGGTLDTALAAAPMVLIEGAKGCGKTWLGLSRARSSSMLAEDPNALETARLLPRELLSAGPHPRLIDEWQRAPAVWDTARGLSDEDGATGKFIFTGSYLRGDAITRHSGAGRMIRVRLRPMSLAETGVSSGEVSLAALMDGEPVSTFAPTLSSADVAELICRGGWPRHLQLDASASQRLLRAYLNETMRVDLPLETESAHDPVRVGRLLRALARNVSTTVSQAALGRETGADGVRLNHQTVSRYLDSLTRLFVLDDLRSWSPHLLSKAPARQAPKRHLVDPSLAVAALGIGPARLAADLRTMGPLFESLAVRDLRVYADTHEYTVLHHRDADGGELDAVVVAPDGRWIAVEVKLGADEARMDSAAALLRRTASRVDPAHAGPPARHVIVTAFGTVAHDRPDGVAVVPIGALGP